jgi:hypothetical protein
MRLPMYDFYFVSNFIYWQQIILSGTQTSVSRKQFVRNIKQKNPAFAGFFVLGT